MFEPEINAMTMIATLAMGFMAGYTTALAQKDPQTASITITLALLGIIFGYAVAKMDDR